MSLLVIGTPGAPPSNVMYLGVLEPNDRTVSGRPSGADQGMAWPDGRQRAVPGTANAPGHGRPGRWSRKRLWSIPIPDRPHPKRAARLVRFDYAAHRLAAGHSAAIVAAESGYADQLHLWRG
jgi:hypothetical protein